MPYTGTDWPAASPPVDEIYTIDFINQLRAGETVTGATISLTVSQGTDTDPASHVIGSYTITGGRYIGQRVRGIAAGNIYNLSITAVTSLGFTPELNAYIVCQAIF